MKKTKKMKMERKENADILYDGKEIVVIGADYETEKSKNEVNLMMAQPTFLTICKCGMFSNNDTMFENTTVKDVFVKSSCNLIFKGKAYVDQKEKEDAIKRFEGVFEEEKAKLKETYKNDRLYSVRYIKEYPIINGSVQKTGIGALQGEVRTYDENFSLSDIETIMQITSEELVKKEKAIGYNNLTSFEKLLHKLEKNADIRKLEHLVLKSVETVKRTDEVNRKISDFMKGRSCGVNDSEAFVKLEMPVDKQNEETSERYAAFSVMKRQYEMMNDEEKAEFLKACSEENDSDPKQKAFYQTVNEILTSPQQLEEREEFKDIHLKAQVIKTVEDAPAGMNDNRISVKVNKVGTKEKIELFSMDKVELDKEIRKKGFDGLSGFEKYCYLTFYGENEFVKDADAAMQECWDDIQNALNHLQYQTN